MIEDLVLNKRDEPYRLFTARSENRLFIREDNTLSRMHKYRAMLNLNGALDSLQKDFVSELEILNDLIAATVYYNTPSMKSYFELQDYGPLDNNITLSELIKRGNLDPIKTLQVELLKNGALFSQDVVNTAAIGWKYEGYINRSAIESEKLSRLSKKVLNLERILSSNQISFECKSRIRAIAPETFGQLQRIEGIRPATLAFVAGNIL
jgi:tRNA uridine 5-carboxymethylaminomethyl modification enzyme